MRTGRGYFCAALVLAFAALSRSVSAKATWICSNGDCPDSRGCCSGYCPSGCSSRSVSSYNGVRSCSCSGCPTVASNSACGGPTASPTVAATTKAPTKSPTSAAATSGTFESGLDGWVNSGYWYRTSSRTPTTNTGAAKAQGGSYFMFLETSRGISGGVSTLTRTVPAGTTAVSWYFHMYGASMGTLRLEAFTAAGGWKSVWSKTGQQHAQQAEAFTAAKATLPSGTSKVRFAGVRGSTITGDMCIDTVVLEASTTTRAPSWAPTVSPTLTPSSNLSATVSPVIPRMNVSVMEPSQARPNIHQRIVLRANVSMPRLNGGASRNIWINNTAVWSSDLLVLDDRTTRTDITATVEEGVSVLFLVLAPKALRGGLAYTFTLRLGSATGHSVHANVSLQTNDIPTGGNITVEPIIGAAVSTLFSLRVAGWTDQDLPLLYAFNVPPSAPGGTMLALSGRTPSATLATKLPQGDGSGSTGNHSLRVGVSVYDTWGAISSASTSIRVTPFKLAPTASMVSTTLALLSDEGNGTYETLRTVGIVASTLLRPGLTSTEDARQTNALLSSALQYALRNSSQIDEQGKEDITAALEVTTRRAEYVAYTALDASLGMMQTLLTSTIASAPGSTIVKSAAFVTSNLLAASMSNLASFGGNTTAAAVQGQSVSKLVDTIAIASVHSAVAGEQPARLTTPGFVLEARVVPVAIQSPLAIGELGQARLPAGTLQSVSDGGNVRTQTVSWKGAGPFFSAGSGFAARGADLGGGGVLTVSLYSNSGKRLKVRGLETPIRLMLDVGNTSANDKLNLVWCTYWDTAHQRWTLQGQGTLLRRADGTRTAECFTPHLTNFGAFLGPKPTFNEMSWDVRTWLTSKLGMYLCGSFVLSTALFCGLSYWQSMKLSRASGQSTGQDRERYDQKVSEFAHQMGLLESPDVSWLHKACINLRTGWAWGAVMCAYAGDPYYRSQRAFIIVLQVLLSLMLNAMFFRSPQAGCLENCNAFETNVSWASSYSWAPDDACVKACEVEEVPNGLQASLVAAAIATPIVGLLNYGFAWLRRPFITDLSVKNGAMLEQIHAVEQSDTEPGLEDPEKNDNEQGLLRYCCARWICNTCHGAKHGIAVQAQDCRSWFAFLRRQRQMLMRTSTVHPDRALEPHGLTSTVINDSTQSVDLKGDDIGDHGSGRAIAGKRRKEVAAQMAVMEQCSDVLFETYDKDGSGVLERSEVHSLMVELNCGLDVSEAAVDFVLQSSHSSGQKEDESNAVVDRESLSRAVSVWRYLQHEQQHMDARFDEFDLDGTGTLSSNQLTKLLTALNGGIPPTTREVEWVLSIANKDDSPQSISRSQVRAAVALWYPRVFARRERKELARAPPAKTGKKRKASAAQIGVQLEAVKHHYAHYASERPYDLTAHPTHLREMMEHMNDGLEVSEWSVKFVLSVAGVEKESSMDRGEVFEALAIWRTLRGVQHEVDTSFDRYDENQSGVLEERQVKNLLTDLNEGHEVSQAEVAWVMEAADLDGTRALDRDELRAAIGLWYFHIQSVSLRTKKGTRSQCPWVFSMATGFACAALVISVSSVWSKSKTEQWIEASALSLVWKLFIIDPVKALFCGSLLEPIATIFLGGGNLIDGAANSLIEELDTQIEGVADAVTDMLVDGGDWGEETGEAASEGVSRVANNAVFLFGGVGAAKFKGKLSDKAREARRTQATALLKQGQDALRRKRTPGKMSAHEAVADIDLGALERLCAASEAKPHDIRPSSEPGP